MKANVSSLIQGNRKASRARCILLLTLALFALSPTARAVSPPPDGGYPGGNTAEGQNALLSLTTGGYNTAVGYLSLTSNTTGLLNTAVGAGTLLVNTSDENTATGAAALLSNATGGQNTASGAFALFSNTSGVRNTASGDRALYSNITGGYNTAYGAGALALDTEGNKNTATGFNALTSHASGDGNTAVGFNALVNQVSGDGNVALGIGAGRGISAASNVICIGADGEDVDNSCYIGNIFGATSPDGVAVFVNSEGRLGTLTSSKRFKDGIKPMDQASAAILALKPVTFRYKKKIDPSGTAHFGLVAEQVEKVNPDLVVHDKAGKPYSVRYEAVNAMLLNEFLKEHRKNEEQEGTITRLERQVEALIAGLHKVRAQLAVNKSTQPVAITDR
ncbi:MAG: tail fiber domain-containing protein [Nitrospirota bacterium]